MRVAPRSARANRDDATNAEHTWRESTLVIDGATRLLAIVGDPVSHARSPAVINGILAQTRYNAVLVPWHVPTADFEVAMPGLLLTRNIVGLVITYPFKQRAAAFADTMRPAASEVGAVNALRREANGQWTGDMFDGLGLVQAVLGLGRPVGGAVVKLFGAGGAGGAIAHALAQAGAAAISIFDVDAVRAETLAASVRARVPSCAAWPGDSKLGDVDILINASPIGMDPRDGLPGDMTGLDDRVAVVDIVPRQDGTPLLALARQRGCKHVGGSAMVQGQAGLLLDFFGFSPKRQEMPT